MTAEHAEDEHGAGQERQRGHEPQAPCGRDEAPNASPPTADPNGAAASTIPAATGPPPSSRVYGTARPSARREHAEQAEPCERAQVAPAEEQPDPGRGVRGSLPRRALAAGGRSVPDAEPDERAADEEGHGVHRERRRRLQERDEHLPLGRNPATWASICATLLTAVPSSSGRRAGCPASALPRAAVNGGEEQLGGEEQDAQRRIVAPCTTIVSTSGHARRRRRR